MIHRLRRRSQLVRASAGAAAAFVPSSISDLSVWLRSSDEVTGGATVSNWGNMGSGNDATAAGAARPDATAGATLNSLVGVKFTPNQYMTISSLALNGYQTWFIVQRSTSAADCFIEHSPTIAANQGSYFYAEGNHGFALNRGGGAQYASMAANWASADTACYVTLRYNGSFTVKKNGVSQSGTPGGSVSNTSTTQTLYIGSRGGSSLFSNMTLWELLIYNAALSDAQIASVESYLSTRYAL